jgi:tRNA A37 N6-isopentenylltransferase MiaA
MTAKATKEETSRVKHHLIDIMELDEIQYNVTKYRNQAMKALEEIVAEKKSAIVVGGTNYYAESLLFARHEENSQFSEALLKPSDLSEERIDIKEAGMSVKAFHPSDLRRTKERVEKLEASQSERLNLNFNKTLYDDIMIIVVVNKDIEFVHQLISKRVNEMLFDSNGFEEVFFVLDAFFLNEQPFGTYKQAELDDDKNRGLMQAIGYKEFIPLYNEINTRVFSIYTKLDDQFFEMRKGIIRNLKQRKFEDFEDITLGCIDELEKRTFKLYKIQLKWLNGRILSSECLKQKINMFEFGNELKETDGMKNLVGKVLTKVDEFIAKPKEQGQLESFFEKSPKQILWCNTCEKGFYCKTSQERHIESKGHRYKTQKHEARKIEVQATAEGDPNYFCEPCKRSIEGQKNFANHLESKPHRKKVKQSSLDPAKKCEQ